MHMLCGKKIACIIPARLKSTRFPRKMLCILKDKPLLQWVWEAAKQVPFFDELAFAIDSEETARLIESFGGSYYLTSEACESGTDRLAELCQSGIVDADIYVNWQGDEPFIQKKMIEELLQSCDKDGDIWTLKKRITKEEEITSVHIAKVVTDAKECALYFSRSPIPHYREEGERIYYKHVGLYAFTKKALLHIATLDHCLLEKAEKLEQLRFLFNHLQIKVHETEGEIFGIDLPEHLVAAERHVSKGF